MYVTMSVFFLTLAPSWKYSLFCLALMFVYVDLYGGILHIVLDNPEFLRLPLIGTGALEFQWHHTIPDDIVSKTYAEVCGDLNTAMLVILGLQAGWIYLDLLLLKYRRPSSRRQALDGLCWPMGSSTSPLNQVENRPLGAYLAILGCTHQPRRP